MPCSAMPTAQLAVGADLDPAAPVYDAQRHARFLNVLLVERRLLDFVDDHYFSRAASVLQPKSQLLLHRGGEARGIGINRFGRRARGRSEGARGTSAVGQEFQREVVEPAQPGLVDHRAASEV